MPISLATGRPFDARQLEALKWCALLSMVVDHVDLVLGRQSVAAYEFGRLAWPVFCIAFGAGLAYSADPMAVVRRLIAPGAAAQCAWVVIDAAHPANVLLSFAVMALGAVWWPAAGLSVVAWPVFEGLWSGPLLVGLAYLGARREMPLALGGLAAAWAVVAPSLGTVAAAALVAAASIGSLPVLPRARSFFAWAYAGHLLLLAAYVV